MLYFGVKCCEVGGKGGFGRETDKKGEMWHAKRTTKEGCGVWNGQKGWNGPGPGGGGNNPQFDPGD